MFLGIQAVQRIGQIKALSRRVIGLGPERACWGRLKLDAMMAKLEQDTRTTFSRLQSILLPLSTRLQ